MGEGILWIVCGAAAALSSHERYLVLLCMAYSSVTSSAC